MRPCEELMNLVLRHYGKFASKEQAESIHDMYSLEDGVVLIGVERDEWLADRELIQAAIKAGSGSQMNIDVQDIEARSEGSVGWTMDRVLVSMPDGNKMPLRHTRIFHQEDGKWKLVHLHVSLAGPDKKN
jgi:ketosteroid isomerase-like protein